MREVSIRVLDDLDKTTEAAETLPLGLRGQWYELDLGAENLRRLEEFLGPYLKAGRRIGEPLHTAPVRGGSYPAQRQLKAEMRAWGKDNGWPDLEPGGYIPKPLREAYQRHLLSQGS